RIASKKDGEIAQIGTAVEILMDPANDYVERFVEDVDLSKVLTAAHVMTRAESITVDRGPRVALEVMRKARVSTVYVTDKAKRLLGDVTADQASEAVKEGKEISDVLTSDIPTISPETLLNDIFEPLSEATARLSIVDEENKLKGMVVRDASIV